MSNRLILASGSPRRKELLEKAGMEFVIHVPDVDETPLKRETPKQMVARLSRVKAKASRDETGADACFLAADTTVVSPTGKILGKPRNAAEARSMLRSLQGKTHRVYTAYTILRGRKAVTRVVETRVQMRKMSTAEIEAYLTTGESMDKAGAYAAQGHGMVLIEKITGSYTNVVGLPVAEVLRDFEKLGVRGGPIR